MRAAVLGRPVSHSLSPLLHRAAYAALGLTDWTYDALDIGAEELPDLIAGLGEEWRGFSVTMPCKQVAVDVADVVEPLPRLLHAANTLLRTDSGGWRAENTDVERVVRPVVQPQCRVRRPVQHRGEGVGDRASDDGRPHLPALIRPGAPEATSGTAARSGCARRRSPRSGSPRCRG